MSLCVCVLNEREGESVCATDVTVHRCIDVYLSTAQIMGTESVTHKSNIRICTKHVKCH